MATSFELRSKRQLRRSRCAQRRKMTQAASSSTLAASTRVGSVAELVALIVQELPVCDRVRALWVSKTWRSEIERLPGWRVELFQSPLQEYEYLYYKKIGHARIKRMALSRHGVPTLGKTNKEKSTLGSPVVRLHPAFEAWGRLLHADLRDSRRLVCFLSETLIRHLQEKSTWHDAFITHPPVRSVTVECTFRLSRHETFAFENFEFTCPRNVTKTDGITVSHMRRALRKAKQESLMWVCEGSRYFGVPLLHKCEIVIQNVVHEADVKVEDTRKMRAGLEM